MTASGTSTSTARGADGSEAPSVLGPGLLIGIGLGGFVDGIVLHQVLQWHHMLTNTPDDNVGLDEYPADTVDGLEVDTLVDGLLHVFTWIAAAANQ